ncbi:non-ribosomal peptide synthase/polyketide synthase [Nocardia bovistercoris]|uniref:Non-ribosomal peptide synthase/polyketide synthase n=1 Tax=Nocardia bovistercoris TaxID=2785916 RepID=A0A931IJ47_9NOCA|nr:non-ribosomal peptide synthase/polyketide synthase [Nocardia bovistercoris]
MHGTDSNGFSALHEEAAPPATSDPTPFPLAPAQLGLWYAQLLDPDTPINIAQYVDVCGELDAGVLAEVSRAAALDYGSTLVRLGVRDGEPYQCVDPALRIDIPLIDLRAHDDPEAAAHAWMRADASAPVDLLRDRLFAGAVLRIAEQRYFWYLRAHHIVLDGFGALTNTMRVAERYTARVLGAEPEPVRASDLDALVRGELAYRDSSRFGADRAHWAERVAGLDAPTSLDGRTAARSAHNLIVGRALPQPLVDRMNALAASQDSTIAVVLLAAFAGYLGRLTDRDDVVLSLPVTARTTAVMRRSAGMLSNIVPLRVGVGPEVSWGDLLRATRVEVAGALRHQRYRHEDIRRDAEHDGRPARRALFGPLANIMLFSSDLTLGTTSGRYHVLSTGPVEDLSLNVYYGERDSVHVDFEANPNLYRDDDLARHHARFLDYLERLAGLEPDAPVISVDAATALEVEVSTEIWNATDFDVAGAVGADATLIALFEAQVARTPDAVALRAAGVALTYRELAARVRGLARRLIASGVGPETLVALHIRRSVDLVVAMYATVAAGGAYLPLDPDHPVERTGHILATARPALLLCAAGSEPEFDGCTVLALDRGLISDTPVTQRERRLPLRRDHPAYVIFTSGSTGLPKGVAIGHGAIVNRLVWMQRTYRLTAEDVVLQKTPATFDVSVWEFFWPLQVGATLVLAEPDGHRDPDRLHATIAEYGVTTAHFVPSMLEAFLAHRDIDRDGTLRTVFASGEALPAATAQRLRVLTGARLHNLYGPTEAAVDVTHHEVTDADTLTVPIGAPVFNTRLYVLDSRLRPTPVGAAGELYLSGVQLARGYVDRPGLTADRFVADPFARGARMYRTGDSVRWTANGALEYLGRTDFQVKLRGLRIELGEIEAVLAGVDSVVRAVVVVRDDAGVGEQLVGYAVESEPGAVTPSALRAAAARALPAYMVPAAYVVLDALPVNASGKLDRSALPAPERVAIEYRAPATAVESAVAGVFAEVLGVELVGRDDDFFALGGNSLVATRVAARLSADLGCPLGVREVFTATTVADLAELIERAGGTGGATAARLRARPRPPLVPLSPAQQRIWFLNRFERDGAGYNMPFVVRLRGRVDVAALRGALADVVDRHEVLRTLFPALPVGHPDGVAAQQVVSHVVSDYEPEPVAADALGAALDEFAAAGFDLEREIPLRVRLFEVGDGSCALVIVLHHIAADGLSLRVLARDVMFAYTARHAGLEVRYADLEVQYADYSLWQREVLGSPADPDSRAARQLAFWTDALAQAPDHLELPTDRQRPAVASGRGAVHRFEIPGAVARGVAELARAQGVSAFMVMHGALAALLSRIGGGADIVIGTPVAGRGERALDELIGMFVNTLVLRTAVRAGESFTALLRRVRDTDLAAFGHADLPFEQLVEAVNPVRSQARHPLFQVLLAFDDAASVELTLPDLEVSAEVLDTGATKFDLQLTVFGGFTGSDPVAAEFGYATDLFDADTIIELAGWLSRLLAGIVADPDAAVGDLPLLDEAGLRAAVARGARGGPDAGVTVLDAFDAQVRRTPDAIAVVDGQRSRTYSEFAEEVDRLARALSATGVGAERTVVLGMRRSLEFVTAAYAVLVAGGAYVPVDPEQPPARLAQIVAEAAPVCVLTRTVDGWDATDDVPVFAVDGLDFVTDRALVSAVDGLDSVADGAPVVVVDGSGAVSEIAVGGVDPAIDSAPAAHRGPRAEGLAYLIFTSGSTGRPKGVAVRHGSMAAQVRWIADEYGIGGADVVLFKTPATFDVSVWELFAPLTRGARIVVAEHDGHRDARYLASVIEAEAVTMTSFVPSMLTVFAGLVEPAEISSLRTVFVAGEAMTGAAAATFAAVCDAELHNLYGPTEFTVHATHAPVDPAASGPSPIGGPVANSRVLVLDERLRPVPESVVGELYLAGVQVARGYHGRGALTAQRFVANPYRPAGERMYRTGDLVRRTRAGALEYLGRGDFQVKLRGQRIELGEIEAALLARESVRAAAVRVHGAAGGEILVAYVVTDLPEESLADVLSVDLRGILPSYMVPAAYVRLEAMPLTSSGKLDRNALPEPERSTVSYRAPETDEERLVAAEFADVLGLDRVGLDDDFFALGGNSLVATQITARLAAAVGAEVPVRSLFEYPTVAGLAAHLPAGGNGRSRRRLVAGPRPDVLALSYAQQRMWFLNQLDGASAAENLAAALRLRGPLAHAALRAAVADVVTRHETLRTAYPAVDGIARQQVMPADAVTHALETESVTEDELSARIAEVVATPFTVDREPPVRLALLRVGTEDHVLVVVIHHIAADGWSLAPLTRDLMLAYAARSGGDAPHWSPLPVQYADFALWQRSELGAEDDPDSPLATQIRFWSDELAGAPDVLALPTDRPRPAAASGRGARHGFRIDAVTTCRLRAVAASANASLFMACHAAFAVLLAKLSGQRDISVGTPVAGRGDRALDGLVGMFVNTLVLRTEVDPDLRFGDLLAAVRASDLRAFEHAEAPFERLVEVLDPPRSAARHPLFQVMLDFQNTAQTALELAGLTISDLEIDTGTAKFDLHLSLRESADGLDAVIEYATDLFDATTVATFAERLCRVMDAAAGDRLIATIDPLSAEERVLLLETRNATAHPVAADATLASLFEAGCELDPRAVAVTFEGESLTRAEFASRVRRLARLLVSIGVGPERTVAVALRRSIDLVVALHAVVVAGGAYVPLDLDHPARRIGEVLDGARPVCVLSRSDDGLELPSDGRWALLDLDVLDTDDYSGAPLTDADRLAPLRPEHTAYVLFTSGSTGRPKGVAVSHAAIVNRLVWMQDTYPIGPEDAVLQKTPATFDVSVWEFFWPAQVGARLVVARPEGHREPAYLADVVRRERVTVVHFVPSMLAVFVADPAAAECSHLRLVFASGEALPPEPARRMRELTGARVLNLYGPTEAAVDVTHHEVTDADTVSVPIGVPVANTGVYVLDDRLRLVAPGVPGELYLSGAQLARGYLGRRDLTADRFVAHPFGAPGARMYRTGDLVAWNRDGELEFLGRTDFQVKVRGLRIELGEIEAAANALDEVAQAAVTVHDGGRLVAYLVAAEREIDLAAVRAALTRRLPAYTVPSDYVVLTEFPLNASGKLDRKALPAPDVEPVAFREPVTATQRAVARVFADVLDRPGIQRVGLDDDFFALGGNSLSAAQVVARVGAVVDGLIPVRVLFEASTVAALAEHADLVRGDGRRIPLTARPRPARIPLAPAQQRIWFLNRFLNDADGGPGDAQDNIPLALRLTGALDAEALTRALGDVIERHESLRTVYPESVDGPEQVIRSVAQTFSSPEFGSWHARGSSGARDSSDARAISGARDRSGAHASADSLGGDLSAAGSAPTDSAHVEAGAVRGIIAAASITETELPERLRRCAAQTFDLTTDLPLRAELFALAPDEHVLVLVLHHIAADGVSLAPLATDLMTAYTARRGGYAPEWAPLPVQYADYSLWHTEILGTPEDYASTAHRQLEFWHRTLDGLPEQLDLPADRPRPTVSDFRGATHRFRIDSDLHSELRELAHKRETTLFTTVHAALAVLLARLSGSGDIAIGTPVAGRGEAELDAVVGMFVNTVVLRSVIDQRARFEAVLDAVRGADLDALSHADIPFEQVVDRIAPTRARNRHPLFQVALSWQNFTMPAVELAGLGVAPVRFDTETAKFDLQFTVLESDDADGRADGLDIEICYATELFDADTVAVLARRYTQVLEAIAADATVVVGDIQLLSAEEQQRALHEWSRTAVDSAIGDDTLADRFAAATCLDPAAVAVVAGTRTLSYAELDAWSNRLARRLIAAGVGPDALVAVALPRSVELVVALVAVLKAGAGYLPVDPNYPADRIEYMLADAAPLCAIGGAATDLPRDWFGGPVLDVAADNLADLDPSSLTDADRRAPLRAADTAYVIYTSGSTGRPKGVVVPHRSVLRLLDNTRADFGFDATDVWTMFHSYAFDFSVWELWGALLYGGRLVVVDYFTSRSPEQFRDLLVRERVTVLNQTPSAFYQLIAADAAHEPAEFALRTVIFGGEALEPQRLDGWFARYGDRPRLVNMYGITETTVHVTRRELAPGSGAASVIGAPIPGLVVRILDARLRPVPVGVPGEIYVSGGQLARGYLGRPALTAGRFVADPYAGDGSLAYRSGDLARWSADGELEYLGRADQQVNLRGFRIELGEIETALLEVGAPSVREAAAVVRTDQEQTRIVGYVVGDAIDTAALRTGLARALPEHMVPAAVVVLDRIPLTVNGKLDRAALPAPVFDGTVYRAPSTVAEEIVAGVFAEVLGRPDARIGADDDFFELGGSSLLAAKAVARIGAALGRSVGVRALFEAPRVTDLAARTALESGRVMPALVAGARPRRLPLSPAQRRMWFLNRFDRESTAYNIPIALRLTGDLHAAALAAALADVMARHESLRTRYPEVDGEPEQVIVPVSEAVPALYPVEITEAALPGLLRELARTRFDVAAHAPISVRLWRIGGDHVLAAVLHHISADGSSIAPFTRDLMLAYAARVDHRAPSWSPLAVQYADYALWQREALGSEDDPDSAAAEQIRYWTEALADLPDQLSLPTDLPRPARQSLRGAKVEWRVDAATHAALLARGRRGGATLFMVVQAAFAAVLARLSGCADIAVGTPIAGRGRAELDDVIGMFVNTLVLRTRVDTARGFEDLLAAVRAADVAAFTHADVPFERLVEVLNPERSTARHPLIQVGYSFQNHDRGALELPGLEVRPIEFDSGVAQFDLHLFAVDTYATDGSPAGIDVALGYATDLFLPATAARVCEQLRRVLDAVARETDSLIGDLDLLGETGRARLLDGWNRTAHPVPVVTLADLAAEQAARTPNAMALVEADGGRRLTYRTFDSTVNRLARRLIEDGIGPETTVILAMRRSLELVIAMYAVVRAGGAYVPIDPDHPADRITHILNTAAPVCVLTTAADGIPAPTELPVLEVDRIDLTRHSDRPIRDTDRTRPLRPEHPAYIIFTSGSTGLPKGVSMSHAAVVNQLTWLRDHFALNDRDTVLLKTPATFDLSVWEFWSPLTTGARLIVTEPGTEREPDRLRDLMARHEVTILHAVPSLIGLLLAVSTVSVASSTGDSVFANATPNADSAAASEAALPTSLRHVLAIGEALAPATASEFLRVARGGTKLWNLYGPTEAAVSITAFEVASAPEHTVPIGSPAWNSRVYVLDGRLQPVPVGVFGELYLAGTQLARGYHARPGLTADRFVADPFGSGAGRMYRTGDIVRRRADGVLEYRERADFQVQIGGFRIELGEVETALRRQPGVRAAVAVAYRDERAGTRLVAYAAMPSSVSAAGDSNAGGSAASMPGADVGDSDRRETDAGGSEAGVRGAGVELRAALTAELPGYMVPATVVVLDALPLNANGKVDRGRLPEPVFAEAEFRAPVSATERLVAETFAEVIGVSAPGLDDDFFALGGNSLLATRLVARLGAALGVRVPVAAVFEATTVSGLAEYVGALDAFTGPALVRRTESGPAPLAPAQQRMWVLNRLAPDSAAYNIPVAIRLTGALDLAVLTAAVTDVLDRHHTLRTRYPDSADGPVQEVLPVGQVAVNLSPVDVDPDEVTERVRDIVATGFDVTVTPPVRAALLRTGTDSYVLVVVLHHIAADGYSVEPMARDLMRAYLDRARGEAPGLAPLAVDYADYSVWQRDLLGVAADSRSLLARQLDYWTRELAGVPELLALPTDRPRQARRDMRGGAVDFVVSAHLATRLAELAREYGATMFTVVHSALAVLLAKLSGGVDIAIGAPVSGRGARELDDLIGMFVNTVVLRTEVDPKAGFADLLRQARDRNLAALAHVETPFDQIVEAMGRTRSSAYSPLFQVMLTFQNPSAGPLTLPGLTVEVLDPDLGEAKYDLQLTAVERFAADGTHTGLDLRFGYAADLFDAATVERLAERLLIVFETVAANPAVAVRTIDIRTEAERAPAVTGRSAAGSTGWFDRPSRRETIPMPEQSKLFSAGRSARPTPDASGGAATARWEQPAAGQRGSFAPRESVLTTDDRSEQPTTGRFGRPVAERPALTDLPDLIAAAARTAPDAIAFTHGAHTISYAALAAKVATVAKAMGAAAKPEALINVSLAGLVPGVLAALGGGGLAEAMRTLHDDARSVAAHGHQEVDSEGMR